MTTAADLNQKLDALGLALAQTGTVLESNVEKLVEIGADIKELKDKIPTGGGVISEEDAAAIGAKIDTLVGAVEGVKANAQGQSEALAALAAEYPEPAPEDPPVEG